MLEQQALGTRLTRAFGLFTLLAGVAIMHAVVFGMSGGSDSSHDMSRMGSGTAITASMGAAHAETMPGCAGGECDGHAGMHGCLFVLTALLLGLGLTLLGWFALKNRETAATKLRRLRAHRARPPPWTVLSLAELAILWI
ncbi:hypothetical protein GFY24_04225 [Nocardia sp. SYP-A9097]|uniref:DUF6153 family protein n=1 Tax=Nocardia sp. SYP-A9097 TaxID=2663237 RepID=UPI00129BD48B|nr:DUF6153 family protein [Nocardia sp. SYP-A9097]MRH86683.1 hypothetical protein [Nocardia sp. SYP-A9097]